MGKKKPFIDKKNSQKFTLVHRSQRDPLQADEESSKKVLIPIEEKHKYGIFFDDNYDYMRHLKSRGDDGNTSVSDVSLVQLPKNEKQFSLPQGALPSTYEEDEGILSRGVLPRGPQPDWDPDVVAALDDDIDLNDPENILEDDFIMKANGGDDDDGWETNSDGSCEGDVSSNDCFSDDEVDVGEDNKSRFTNYSMTSSVIHRTDGLKMLDDQFEKIMEEYDEDDIGCYDNEDVSGNLNTGHQLVKQLVEEFELNQKKHNLSEMENNDSEGEYKYSDDGSNEVSDKELFKQFERAPKEKWDCESIISTYSNLYNHPKMIIENLPKKINLHKQSGIPVGVFNNGIIKEEKVDSSNEVIVCLNNVRTKNETPEEKKFRKQEVKRQRQCRRQEKKSNKEAFKSEIKKQEKVLLNKTSQKGLKL